MFLLFVNVYKTDRKYHIETIILMYLIYTYFEYNTNVTNCQVSISMHIQWLFLYEPSQITWPFVIKEVDITVRQPGMSKLEFRSFSMFPYVAYLPKCPVAC